MSEKAQDIVARVEAHCRNKGIRFTEPRRLALEAIARAGKPLGAYDILALLAKRMDNPKPPTVYRAIEFLVEQHIIHRIESMNAYILCQSDHRHSGSQFMICDSCGQVEEAHLCDLPAPISAKTQAQGFQTTRWNLELHGTCSACSGQPHHHAHCC